MPSDAETMPEQRVAVTVFATVRGGDAQEAALVAQRALQQAFAAAANSLPRVALPLEIPVKLPGGCETVRIVAMRETGAAARNGYLWVEPTPQAWQQAPDARSEAVETEGSGRGGLG
ncbi:hypothetical protein L3Q65_00815 (plasmid) [Amycolatopsis sp. FU40]|uniref:hypothetical protein n=1 Tax=Amycolatopsis sp. FU40 TaxID=2914159 RepID=UPI001F3FF9F4|nr:hypothetical protein [Amycolatopsis sp. FU40]UKD50867.1 hypothetical protein L3Q65_00815 [Amycolatopsis sp. FU40]